jgi:hypothetical protein
MAFETSVEQLVEAVRESPATRDGEFSLPTIMPEPLENKRLTYPLVVWGVRK